MCQKKSTLCKFSVGYMKGWLDLERWEAMQNDGKTMKQWKHDADPGNALKETLEMSL